MESMHVAKIYWTGAQKYTNLHIYVHTWYPKIFLFCLPLTHTYLGLDREN
jgi:hypothetical protein